MSMYLRAFALCISIGWLSLACLQASAQTTFAPQQGVLVLRNGSVIHGPFTRLGDRYVVTRDDGSELRLPAEDVELHCRNLIEAYQLKCATLPIGKVKSHVELAQWCLRQNMLAEAADQLLMASALDPENPKVKQLERQLRVMVSAPEKPETSSTTPARTVARPDLEQMVDGLPGNTVQQFTLSVQPILLNYCGASRCHGWTSNSEFQLFRPNWSRSIPTRITQRNLHATLKWVDRNHPDQSPLLTVALEPHGGSQTAVFNQQSLEQYELLAQWVRQLARQPVETQPVTIEKPNAVLMQPAEATVAGRDPAETAERPEVTSTESAETDAVEPLPPSTPSPQGFVPRDPFDPQIFNRRFFGTSASR